ncbi:hypothetical protein [Alteribacter lacisalsi]|nr:hypothetical protein [Alteribacter lacisalsi]
MEPISEEILKSILMKTYRLGESGKQISAAELVKRIEADLEKCVKTAHKV